MKGGNSERIINKNNYLLGYGICHSDGLGSRPGNRSRQIPNILLIVSDDTGYGDLGPYGGGEGRGMPTPTFDRMAADGMTFLSFYAQPSCTPGRAAIQKVSI